MTTTQTPELVQHFLKSLENPYKQLTAWELGFLESITDQFERTSRLSAKQFETLERIYAEKTE